MNEIFLKVLNMSIIASYIIIAAVIIRLLFKKAPKWINCLIWSMVGIRLVLPFSVKSMFSIIPRIDAVPSDIIQNYSPAINNVTTSGNTAVNQTTSMISTPGSAPDIISIIAVIWIVGMVLLMMYGILSYILLRRKVSDAEFIGENIYRCMSIESPFILGIIKARIYLPYGMAEINIPHIIAHENAHLKRKDHWIKPLGYFLLAIYWFNPIVWVAYILLCRDIELACDEAVIKRLGEKQKKPYSEALLSCSMERRTIAACPLAFGEIGVKDRIKNVLNYRKPTLWIIVITIVVSVILATVFLTNPKDKDPVVFLEGTYAFSEAIYMNPLSSYYPFENTGELYHLTDDGLIITNKETGEQIIGLFSDLPKVWGFSNRDWAELFMFEADVVNIRDFSKSNRAVWELKDDYRLYIMEDEVWLMRLSGKNGVWSIYKLKQYDEAVDATGSSSFTPEFWDPMLNLNYVDSLDVVIRHVIFTANQNNFNTGDIATEAYTLLKKADNQDELILYVMAMYLEFNNIDGQLVEASGSHSPVVITLEKGDNGGYGLEEYWTPDDGAGYMASLKSKFPDNFNEDLFDTQKFVNMHIQTCYASAVAQSGIDADARIAELIEIICSSPAYASNPNSYIQEHQAEYMELVNYGVYTMTYCSKQFIDGGQTGLEGHIMAMAYREISMDTQYDEKFNYSNGQQWFDEFQVILNKNSE